MRAWMAVYAVENIVVVVGYACNERYAILAGVRYACMHGGIAVYSIVASSSRVCVHVWWYCGMSVKGLGLGLRLGLGLGLALALA